MAEHPPCKRTVRGSSPFVSKNIKFILIMTIDLHAIIKNAVKDALEEYSQEFSHEPNSKDKIQNNESPLLTIKQFCQKHTFISSSAIRALIFHSEYNGFHIVFSRIGRKILIDEQKALNWFKDPPPESKTTCYQSCDKKTIYKYKK